MGLKVFALFAILVYCNAQHLIHHEYQKPTHHHELPVLVAAKPIVAISKGHAVSSQSIHLTHSPSDVRPHSSGSLHGIHSHHHEEEYGHPAYEFKYSVHDPHTGDEKSQSESRDGDVVKGEYMLLQPDGHYRKVTYHADKHSGFQAEVSYSPAGH